MGVLAEWLFLSIKRCDTSQREKIADRPSDVVCLNQTASFTAEAELYFWDIAKR